MKRSAVYIAVNDFVKQLYGPSCKTFNDSNVNLLVKLYKSDG